MVTRKTPHTFSASSRSRRLSMPQRMTTHGLATQFGQPCSRIVAKRNAGCGWPMVTTGAEGFPFLAAVYRVLLQKHLAIHRVNMMQYLNIYFLVYPDNEIQLGDNGWHDSRFDLVTPFAYPVDLCHLHSPWCTPLTFLGTQIS